MRVVFVPRTPINGPLWLLLVMVGVSVVVTPDLGGSLNKVSGLVLSIVVFWAVVGWLQTTSQLKVMTVAFVGVSVVVSVAGLIGVPAQHKFAVLGDVASRLSATHVGDRLAINPNPLSGCLLLFIPLQTLLIARAGRDWLATRAWSRLVFALQLIGLVMSAGTFLLMQSRGAWSGLAIAVAVVAGWRSRRSRQLAIAAAAAGLVIAIMAAPRVWTILQHPAAAPSVGNSIAVRLELWSKAIRGILDFPLTGMGMNMFRQRMPVLYPGFLIPQDVDVVHAHNDVLQAALDVGIPGLLAYLAIWIGTIRVLVSVYRTALDPIHRTIALGLGTGLVAYFVFGLTDAITLGAKAGVLLWLTLAYAIGLGQLAVRPTR